MSLEGKTLFITGGSRGIGLEIAKKAAADGANIAIAAKTIEPHPNLPGTIYTAAAEIEEAGGKALAIVCDIRFEDQMQSAIAQTVEKFGGIDICINNASAVSPTSTEMTEMKRYDLMNNVNARGTFLATKTCLPHLKKGNNPHVLNLSPPLDMKEKWFAPHVAYTMAKMGMSFCTLGHAREFKDYGIAVNSLWPLTAIDTAAVRNILGGDEVAKNCRTPQIMADAAYAILNRSSAECTGNFFIDEALLREEGVTDFGQYEPETVDTLVRDFFVPDEIAENLPTKTFSPY